MAATSLVLLGFVVVAESASAGAPGLVNLGNAAQYSVLAGSTVTNTNISNLAANVGLNPGTSVTGFPPGLLGPGATIHAADFPAINAQSDLTTAYNDAAGRTPDATETGDLGGQTFVAGVYKSTHPLELTGTVTLDAQGDSTSVFIFQADSTLVTATNSTVNLINGAQACRVYWQVGSSATLQTSTKFKGTILAQASITVNNGVVVEGRALARTAAVTLDGDTFIKPGCVNATPTTSAPGSSTGATTGATTAATDSTPATTAPGDGGVTVFPGGVGIVSAPPLDTSTDSTAGTDTGTDTGTGTGTVATETNALGTAGVTVGALAFTGPAAPVGQQVQIAIVLLALGAMLMAFALLRPRSRRRGVTTGPQPMSRSDLQRANELIR
jgi:hypothetical protein